MFIDPNEEVTIVSAILSILRQREETAAQGDDDAPCAITRRSHRLPVLVAISGVPGSGKTTLAKHLTKALNDRLLTTTGRAETETEGPSPLAAASNNCNAAVVNVPMDGYHLPRAALAILPDAEEAFRRRGAEWTFDPVRLARDLRELTETREWWAPAFDHAAKDPVEQSIHVTKETQIVVVEGNYLTYRGTAEWAAVVDLFDYKIFLDVPSLELSTARLAKRHQAAWGVSWEEAMERASGSDLRNAQLVETTKGAADVICKSLDADVC